MGHAEESNCRGQQHNGRMTIPYGLDCSGFVDWVFNNTSVLWSVMVAEPEVSTVIAGKISWAEAQPGFGVLSRFRPCWIVAGYDGDGNVLIVHCSLNGCCGNGTSWVYVGWQTGGVLEYKSKKHI